MAAGADELAIRHTLLTPKIVGEARREGLGVVAWTANREKEIRRLIHLGVDRIISNYPDRIIRLLVE